MRFVSITVGQERIEAVTAFDEGEPLRTSSFPGLPDRAMRLLPGLRGHRCDNGAGLTFAREMADTEVAHLLEHVAVELLALSGSPDTLGGRTVWDFRADGRGVFRVLLDFDDDLVAIGALKEAEAIVGWLTGAGGTAPPGAAAGGTASADPAGGPAAPLADPAPPDVRAAVARLREARRR